MSTDLFALLADKIESPLVLLDVGGHGGALESWKRFGDKARIFCFEARNDEAEALVQNNQDAQVEYVSCGLSNDHAGLDIHVALAAGCSSAYPPIEKMYRRYPALGIMRPIGKVHCATTTIDDFLEERGIGGVHGMKLDTQGFELRILEGAENALRSCQFILVEAEFNPLYEGQPLFADVDRFLRERGFVLWRMQNLAHYATLPLGGEPHRMMVGSDPGVQQTIDVANGQLFWADCYYVRREATAVSDTPLDRCQAIAGAALVSQWNFADLAMEMIRKSGDRDLLTKVEAILDCAFVPSSPDRIPATDFSSQALVLGGGKWRTDFSMTDAFITYGPYIRLPYGEFEVGFHVETEGLGRQALRVPIRFDVAADTAQVEVADLVGREGADRLRDGVVRLRFFNSQPKALFEFRIATFGLPFDGALLFSGVSLRHLGAL